jgi:hypothetical protein
MIRPGTACPPTVSNSIRMTPVQAIFRKFGHLLAEASRSRLVWLLAFLHAACYLLAIANMSPPSRGVANFIEQFSGLTVAILAGRPFHFAYESLFLQLLTLFDLPSRLLQFPSRFSVSVAKAPSRRILRGLIHRSGYSDCNGLSAMASCRTTRRSLARFATMGNGCPPTDRSPFRRSHNLDSPNHCRFCPAP